MVLAFLLFFFFLVLTRERHDGTGLFFVFFIGFL